MNVQPAIQFHIEELVLHGFSPGDRHRIADALERQLTIQAASASDTMRAELLGRAGERHVTPVLRAAECRPARTASGISPDAIAAGVSQSIVSALAGDARGTGHG